MQDREYGRLSEGKPTRRDGFVSRLSAAAFTPVEQRAVRAAAETFRPNPQLDLERVIQEMTVGEALASMLQGQGEPSVTQRTRIRPPSARIGPLTPAERRAKIETSPLYGKYENTIDRESAYEMLQKRTVAADKPESAWGGTVRAGRSSSSNSLLGSLTSSLGRAIGRKPPKGQ
jgi:DNA helicase HerA-like ATPase